MIDKATFSRYWQKQGKWPEVEAFKNQAIRDARASGLRGEAAKDAGWEKAFERFPLPEPPPDRVPPPPAAKRFPPIATPSPDPPSNASPQSPDPSDDLLDLSEIPSPETPDFFRDGNWVYERLGDRSVTAADAPSKGAWQWLRNARKYTKAFYENVVPKLMARVDQTKSDDAENIRECELAADEIDEVLRQLRNSVKD